MENKANVIKVKGTSIKLPSKAKLVDAIDLDNRLGPKYSGKHNDICVVIECPGSNIPYAVLIENTGTPTLDDAERFHETIDALKSNNIINRTVIIKIIHHTGGVRTPLLRVARRENVELIRCQNRIDIDELFRKREITC